MLERKAKEKSDYLDKIADMRTRVKQNEEETVELENQRILCLVAMSEIDIHQLKDMLSGIKNNPSSVIAPTTIQTNTTKYERTTDDEENE